MEERQELQEQEVWKDIPGYEGLYQVNQWGDIYSLYTHKKLKWSLHKDGYKIYNLHKNKKAYLMTAHRAVALAFIPNPDNLPVINHKDENPENCYIDNLEWCTTRYNNIYSDNGKRAGIKLSKKAYCYNLDGTLFNIFNSVHEASEYFKSSTGNISESAQWKTKENNKKIVISVKNKIFSYVERSEQEVQERSKLSICLNRKNNAISKPVVQLTLNNEKIQEFPSTREVERQLGIPSSQVGRAARGYNKGYVCHSFKWKYTDD